MTLKGVIPVIPTPFSENGQDILYDKFSDIIQMTLHEGASAVMLFGAGGEFYKLTDSEKVNLLKLAVEVSSGRGGVVTTVTPHSTLHAQRQAVLFQEMGARAVNIMPPSFASPSPSMILEHIVEVSRAIRVPLIIQYAPALTGSGIPLEVFEKIRENVGGELYIKVEASPTGPAITALLDSAGDGYNIAIGNGGECLFEAWQRGARVVMPGGAFVKPYCDFINAWEKGNRELALSLYNKFLPYLHFIYRNIEEFVYMEKYVLMERGYLDAPTCRKPGITPDGTTLEILSIIADRVKKDFY